MCVCVRVTCQSIDTAVYQRSFFFNMLSRDSHHLNITFHLLDIDSAEKAKACDPLIFQIQKLTALFKRKNINNLFVCCAIISMKPLRSANTLETTHLKKILIRQ